MCQLMLQYGLITFKDPIAYFVVDMACLSQNMVSALDSESSGPGLSAA